eukprot:5082997-Alexandrium_andersonii.AAC.1
MNRCGSKVETCHGPLCLPHLHLVLNPAATYHGKMQQFSVYCSLSRPVRHHVPSVCPHKCFERALTE